MKKLILSTIALVSVNVFANDVITGIVSGIGVDVKKNPIPESMLSSDDSQMVTTENGYIAKKDVFIVCTDKGGTIYVRNGSEYDDGSSDIQAIGKLTPDQCGFDH